MNAITFGKHWKSVIFALLALFLVLAPAILPTYPVSVLTEIIIFTLFAMSLNILLGYGGLPSLGHSAFFGTGGYAVGLLAKYYGIPAAPALFIAVVAGIIVALITGPFVLRTHGAYFLILTLSLTQVLFGIVWLWRNVTGGDDGLPGIPMAKLPFLAGRVSDTVNFYYLTLLIVGIAIAAIAWILRSPFGLALVGIRENERYLEGLGYPTWRIKYVAYALAGGFGALAGGLFAYFKGFVGPGQLSWLLAGEGMVMVILGGAGTFWGPAVGALLVLLLRYEVSAFTQRWVMILGIVFILNVLLLPQGIVRLPERIRDVRARLRRETILVPPIQEASAPAERSVERVIERS
ncbi:branched-chain amino acid ABC transporter permease [Thermomicrobium sp. 4228-Ro]|uniref:branched-chain amino acid ABC transporter permease n=1 Tax=Thermomicrobium sp. 4228-Ro TaxID=2993937 RepID=UPI0022490B68|nr:branched-chain amino acid ABC transporter permease [Thermomicrobium sp. 4228-Ro]MCX2726621.1 branched-chain amino acid ABC transporter permease [Thermomicrobium sp. 4228-Ro]